MSHNYHPHCGCAACCRIEEADERRDEAIDAMLADPKWRARNTEAADERSDGERDGEWYSDVERALADLHAKHPADLGGSDLLPRLYRLAKVAGEAREAALRDIAGEQYDQARAA